MSSSPGQTAPACRPREGRWFSNISNGFDSFVSALNAIGTVWIFVIMVLINADVAGRYLFNSPLRGVPLLIELSIAALIFLQIPAALRDGRMTRSDAFIGRLLVRRPAAGHVLEVYIHVVGAALMAVLFIY